MAKAGKVARIRYSAAAATSSTNNAATLSTDGVTLTINSTAKRLWNKQNTTALSVFGTSTATAYGSTTYTVRWPVGQVIFNAAKSTTVTYTIDVESHAATYLGAASEWTLDTENNLLEQTAFSTSSTADAQWRTFTAGLSRASGGFTKFISSGATGPIAWDRINSTQKIAVELWIDSTSRGKYVGWGWFDRLSPNVPLDGSQTEAVSWTLDGPLYYSTA